MFVYKAEWSLIKEATCLQLLYKWFRETNALAYFSTELIEELNDWNFMSVALLTLNSV